MTHYLDTQGFQLDYDGCIEQISYTDYLGEHGADETTTPRGVAPRNFVETEEVHFWRQDVIDINEADYELEDFNNNVQEFEEAILNHYVDNVLSIWVNGSENITLSDFTYNEKSDDYYLEYYVVSSWGCRGNNYTSGKYNWNCCFKTEEEADKAVYEIWEQNLEGNWDAPPFFEEEWQLIEYYADIHQKETEVVERYFKIKEAVKLAKNTK